MQYLLVKSQKMTDIGLNMFFSHIFDGLKMFFSPISDGLFFAEPVGTYEKGTFSIGKGNHSEAVGFFLKKDFFFRNNFTNKFNNVKKTLDKY